MTVSPTATSAGPTVATKQRIARPAGWASAATNSPRNPSPFLSRQPANTR